MDVRWFKRPAPLGALRTLNARGDIGADVQYVAVTQVWQNGVMVSEVEEIKRTGKVALALGAS